MSQIRRGAHRLPAAEEDAAEKLTYDLFYVKSHNLFLDFTIMAQTVEIVAYRSGGL